MESNAFVEIRLRSFVPKNGESAGNKTMNWNSSFCGFRVGEEVAVESRGGWSSARWNNAEINLKEGSLYSHRRKRGLGR